MQQDVLALALANMIWKMGNGKSATLCLPQPSTVHVKGSTKFNEDGLTEKVFTTPYLISFNNFFIFLTNSFKFVYSTN